MTASGFASLLLAALGLPGLSLAAPAAPGPLVPPVLRAGETVTLALPTLPDEAEEFELLLSVDGGETYPLRLSPSLDPRESSFTWTVPALPADRARLRVRWGDDGRNEVESSPSEAFAIRTTQASRLAPLYVDSGELWIGKSSRAALEPPAMSGHRVRIGRHRSRPALASGSSTLVDVRERAGCFAGRARVPRATSRRDFLQRSPGTIPLRI